VEKGVKSITVDGNSFTAGENGWVLPAFGDGKAHQVKVVMG
jgi:hypothetical protein